MRSGQFETSDGARLNYLSQLRDGPHPLLVFVPGWTIPAAIWQRQIDHFAGRYPLVAFDPRGQGDSEAPPQGYTLERRVRDLHELLGSFPGRDYVLVGWSLAVLECLALTDHFPTSRLRGLVLVDNSVGEGADPPRANAENPLFDELRKDRAAALRRFVRDIFRQLPGEALEARILDSAMKLPVEDSIRLLSYGKPRSYWRACLGNVSVPVLYLVTSRWREQADAVARKYPQARVEIFEEAGHALFWDEAGRFNATLEEFLRLTGA